MADVPCDRLLQKAYWLRSNERKVFATSDNRKKNEAKSDMDGLRANPNNRENKVPKVGESEERKSKLRLAHREKAADPSKSKIL